MHALRGFIKGLAIILALSSRDWKGAFASLQHKSRAAVEWRRKFITRGLGFRGLDLLCTSASTLLSQGSIRDSNITKQPAQSSFKLVVKPGETRTVQSNPCLT